MPNVLAVANLNKPKRGLLLLSVFRVIKNIASQNPEKELLIKEPTPERSIATDS